MLKQQDNKGIRSSMQYLHEKECGFFMIYIFTTLKFENTYISYAVYNIKCKFEEKNISQFSCLGKLGRHGSVHSMHSKHIRLDEDLKLNSAITCSNFL